MFKTEGSLLGLVFIALSVMVTPAQATDFSMYPHRLDVEVYSGAQNQATFSTTSYSTEHRTLDECQNRITDLNTVKSVTISIPGEPLRKVGIVRVMHCTLITQ